MFPVQDELSGEVQISKCGHLFCSICASNIGEENCSICQKSLDQREMYTEKELIEGGGKSIPNTSLRQQMLQDRKTFLATLESSTKIDEIIHYLRNIPRVSRQIGETLFTEVAEQAIVFSQWTTALDILEHFLTKEGILHRRIDGQMTPPVRDRQLKEFQQSPQVPLFHASHKIFRSEL